MGTTASMTPVSPVGRPVCEALELYEASRPIENLPSIREGSLAIFISFTVLWVSSILGFILARNEPRFRTVRPLVVNIQFIIAELLFMMGNALNQAVTDFPCVLMLFCLLLGVCGFSLSLLSRAIVYAVESQFARRAAKKESRINDSDELERQSEFTTAPSEERIFERLYSNFVVLKLALGFVSADEVSTVHLARAKRSYGLVSVIAFTPAIVSGIIHLIVVPTFQSCVGCSIFFDVAANLATVGSASMILAARIIYVAWKAKFDDSQGVYFELVSVMCTVAPLFVATGTVIMIDPDQVSFRREFLYEWLLILAVFVYWWWCAGLQFYLAYRDHTRVRVAMNRQVVSDSVHTDSPPVSNGGAVNQRNTIDFMHKFETDDSVKLEFEAFAVKQYAVENLHFSMDVRAFKRYFGEKGDSWRKQKARWLFETYVKPNSVMEVNMSHTMKQDIIGKIEVILKEAHSDTRKLEFAFDVTVEDIITNIIKPMWIAFELERIREKKSKKTWTRTTMSSMSTRTNIQMRATVADAVVPSPVEEEGE